MTVPSSMPALSWSDSHAEQLPHHSPESASPSPCNFYKKTSPKRVNPFSTFHVDLELSAGWCPLHLPSPFVASLFIFLRYAKTFPNLLNINSKVNGKCHISGSASTETLGSIFKKFCMVDYVGDPTPHASTGVNRFKGMCLRMREIVTLRRQLFFFFKA